MIEILPGLYRIEVPLPGNPLKAVNSYVIKDGKRNLVIDTGMDRPECREALATGLAELQIDLDRTDFFITHLHADHIGLVTALAVPGAAVYFNRPDAESLESIREPGVFLALMVRQARRAGWPESEIENSVRQHPGFQYSPPDFPPFTYVSDGQVVEAGNYRFRCVETPGHTQGHMCLYEAEKRLLIAGDHILGDITPNITLWRESDDPLRDYLDSLDRVAQLEVDLVLPGHRRVVRDCHGRIEELKTHHRERLEEILSILDGAAETVYEVTARMSWDIKANSWREFPPMAKWFAVGEAASHLRYLVTEGRVRTAETRGAVRFLKV